MKKSKTTFEIIILENGKTNTFVFPNRKEKNKWLYNYLLSNEQSWVWEQWKNSQCKTFDKWFKTFLKPKMKSDWQKITVGKKIILIKEKIN